ncbi:peptidylprolyl isomerase [Haliangium sp.]|uniref:peptidylprolyl isomerase n=1 Tax=Haliangium sp. TaxID=2663208 RepID=UPI003D0C31AF
MLGSRSSAALPSLLLSASSARAAVTLAAVALATIALASGCGARTGDDTHTGGELEAGAETTARSAAVAIELARAEAARGSGLDRLTALARTGPIHVRARAVRGIGRTGTPAARALLDQLVADPEPAIQEAALGAIALAGHADAEPVVAGFLDASSAAHRRTAAESLGAIGTEASLPALTDALADPVAEVRAAAAVALGFYGRRAIALPPATVQALLGAAGNAGSSAAERTDDSAAERTGDRATSRRSDSDRDLVRYGVAYALGRQHQPGPEPDAGAVLAALARDADPETRALAVRAIGARAQLGEAPLQAALADADWRVRTEAVRALAARSAAGRARVAAWLSEAVTAMGADLDRLDGPGFQPVVEALTVLRAHMAEAPVRAAFDGLWQAGPIATATPIHIRRATQLRCLVAAGRGRVDEIRTCTTGPADANAAAANAAAWPAYLRDQLAAEHAEAAALAPLLTADDPRVRAAALSRALDLDPVPAAALEAMPGAIAAPDPSLSGPVIDAVARRFIRPDDGAAAPPGPPFADLLDHLAARARAELDREQPEIELLGTIFDALSGAGRSEHAEVCARGLGHWNRTVRAKARGCLAGLDPAAAASATEPTTSPPPLPVDVAGVAGRRVRWRLDTTAGGFTIELDAASAPWHVAVIAHLAERGAYDGLPWHRVVAGFVVQGGDPTGSGWGGPGYVVPAEPTAPGDGGRYDRGAVGIADAGLDTGGCQIFIMHARAPHLEGRYTRVGVVVEGMDVVDRLAVGDVIERSRVELLPR